MIINHNIKDNVLYNLCYMIWRANGRHIIFTILHALLGATGFTPIVSRVLSRFAHFFECVFSMLH
jgi:hypothetical protein